MNTPPGSSLRTSLRHLAFLFLLPCSLFPQGSLIPPGAPLPTMKTLDQVEARTPLAGGTSPLGASSGSYYLTGNVTISIGANGITISGSNVTIDLNGFTLTGPGSGSGAGIFLNGGVSNVLIFNGTIRNWGGAGINSLGNPHLRAERLRVISNGGGGIAADVNAEVVNCVADSNVGTGVKGTDNCLIKDCQASGTTGSPGHGILLGMASFVTGCVANGNLGNGISVGQGCVVSLCSAFGNGNGIAATSNCYIVSNNCMNNGGGINTSGQSNRIDANHVTSTSVLQTGIFVSGDRSFIIRNTARGNAANYDIAANNNVGFIVSAPASGAIFGSTGGAGVGSTDPWANFSF